MLKMACGCPEKDVQKKISLRFFKIILEDNLRNNKLGWSSPQLYVAPPPMHVQIPKRIVNSCGGTLSSSVFLKLPRGLQWKVGLTKRRGKVWIENGWADFSKYYSLGRGDLLVFKYEGNSEFHVLIFDKTTTEIDYPSNRNRFKEKCDVDIKPLELGKEKDDTSVKTRVKSPLPCSRPQKRRKISPKEDDGGKSVPPKSKICENIKKQKLNAMEKAHALKIASDFNSKDPYFIVSMQPSYVGVKYLLNVPYLFAMKYLINERGRVILEVPNGRKTWAVQYSRGMYGTNSKAKFDYGWKAFVKDNELKVGDVCVFVLTKSVGISFEVAIFRINGIANSSVLPAVHNAATFKAGHKGSSSGKPESDTLTKKTSESQFRNLKKEAHNGKSRASPVERASGFQSENSFFTVTLGASYAITVPCRFYIPYKFANTHINKIEGEAILKVSNDDRSWSVQYKVRDKLNQSPAAEFCRGWTQFARDNSLEEGDICTFELIKGNDISFEVFILKANHDRPRQAGKNVANEDPNNPSARFQTEGASCKDHETCNTFQIDQIAEGESDFHHQGEINVEPSDKFGKTPSKDHMTSSQASGMVSTSTNPYFKVELRASSHLNLHLPLGFAEKYFEPKEQNVTLQVGKQMWRVMMVVCSGVYIFYWGWPAFVRESNLEPGDYCVFELVGREEDQVLLNVSKISSPTSRSS